ncbi:MAG: hypothetical protein J6S67_05450 [Methanobrevibacter sp.]|nr:hypothetical protein [Methanobrevibacter sp.]
MKKSKMTKGGFNSWRDRIQYMIFLINQKNGSDLTGENFYQLEYRGRAHHVCLTCDGDIIARGMHSIEENVGFLFAYYKLGGF